VVVVDCESAACQFQVFVVVQDLLLLALADLLHLYNGYKWLQKLSGMYRLWSKMLYRDWHFSRNILIGNT
jgi:hypothetical protein